MGAGIRISLSCDPCTAQAPLRWVGGRRGRGGGEREIGCLRPLRFILL